MKIAWTRFAADSLREIYEYYYEIASKEIAVKIRTAIVSEAKKINKFPLSGQKQELLLPLQQGHRYFLKGHYKIIYRIVNDEIVITDVFDTRQHPSKMNTRPRK